MSDTSVRPATELRVKEVAFLLGVSPKTVYDWCRENRIVYIRIMGSIRIPLEAVRAAKRNPPEAA